MVEGKNWEEFRKTGLLLFLNQFLHIFGWTIVLTIKDGVVTEIFPARVKFRGFDEKSTTEAYESVTNYLADNIDSIKKDLE